MVVVEVLVEVMDIVVDAGEGREGDVLFGLDEEESVVDLGERRHFDETVCEKVQIVHVLCNSTMIILYAR